MTELYFPPDEDTHTDSYSLSGTDDELNLPFLERLGHESVENEPMAAAKHKSVRAGVVYAVSLHSRAWLRIPKQCHELHRPHYYYYYIKYYY